VHKRGSWEISKNAHAPPAIVAGAFLLAPRDNRRRIPCYSLLQAYFESQCIDIAGVGKFFSQNSLIFPVNSLLLKFPLAAHVAELLDPIERLSIFSPVKKARPASFDIDQYSSLQHHPKHSMEQFRMSQAFDVALYDAVQRWARQIRATSGGTVETILATGQPSH